jgi:hypothetical protein
LVTISDMPRRSPPPLPRQIAGIAVPQDDVSRESWQWADRRLPGWLRRHSIRSYFWGAAIADRERIAFDRSILWTASLMHDVGLTTLTRNTMCFEVEGAERARRFARRHGMTDEAAERVAIAIILHMRAGVTLDDGPESVLLDRATAVDVRGAEFQLVHDVRPAVTAAFPRGNFDDRFLAAIRREVAVRRDCQSGRLLNSVGLAEWMARSPWISGGEAESSAP